MDSNFPIANPFLEYLEAKCLYANTTGCLIELEIKPNLTNSWGMAHGGVLMTLMDVSMSWAARFYNDIPVGAMTINFNANFIASGTGILTCKAKVIHKTLTLAFCESTIIDIDNNLIANATATFKYAKKLD